MRVHADAHRRLRERVRRQTDACTETCMCAHQMRCIMPTHTPAHTHRWCMCTQGCMQVVHTHTRAHTLAACSCPYTRAHHADVLHDACTHPCTQHTHSRVHKPAHICMLCMHTSTFRHAHKPAHLHSHMACTHIHTRIHRHACTHTHAHAHICMHKHVQACTRLFTQACLHTLPAHLHSHMACMHTHSCKYTVQKLQIYASLL